MPDEILFRGKRIDNGKWVEGWYLIIDGISYVLPVGGHLHDIVEVDPSTVRQCNDKWINVKDRLPDNSEYDWVLASVQESNGYRWIPLVMEYRQNRDDWYEDKVGWLSSHNGLFAVTHWTPLPESPGEEDI